MLKEIYDVLKLIKTVIFCYYKIQPEDNIKV